MDTMESLTLDKFEEFNVSRKDAVYRALLEFIPIIDEVPKKSLRRTLQLALAVMAYKGAQLDALEQQWVPSEKNSPTEDTENNLKNLSMQSNQPTTFPTKIFHYYSIFIQLLFIITLYLKDVPWKRMKSSRWV